MKILSWCGRHKIWSFLIVAIIAGAISGFSATVGRTLGEVFILYLVCIWVFGAIKRRLKRAK